MGHSDPFIEVSSLIRVASVAEEIDHGDGDSSTGYNDPTCDYC